MVPDLRTSRDPDTKGLPGILAVNQYSRGCIDPDLGLVFQGHDREIEFQDLDMGKESTLPGP